MKKMYKHAIQEPENFNDQIWAKKSHYLKMISHKNKGRKKGTTKSLPFIFFVFLYKWSFYKLLHNGQRFDVHLTPFSRPIHTLTHNLSTAGFDRQSSWELYMFLKVMGNCYKKCKIQNLVNGRKDENGRI